MNFDINNYKGKYVMHCKTEEEAKSFCEYLSKHGRKWNSDESYLNRTNWAWYEEQTTYNFNEGSYCDIGYFKRNNYTILEWEDFMNNTFTKGNLKTGDIIKLRDGCVGIVNADLEMAITRNGWINLRRYNDDLTSKVAKDFDIIAVRRPTNPGDCQFNAFDHNWGTLVYERKEVEEMTLAQVCKLLGKNIKIIQ